MYRPTTDVSGMLLYDIVCFHVHIDVIICAALCENANLNSAALIITVLCCIIMRHGVTFLLPPAPPFRTINILRRRAYKMFLKLTLTLTFN